MATLKEALDQLAKGHELDNEQEKLIIDKWQKELGIQPCEDAISRADAINKVTNFYTNCERLKMFRHTSNEVKQTVTDILCDLPPVTPKPKMGHWIPISERLPKDDKDVLVCDSQGAMEVCYYHVDDNVYPTEFADLNETGWYNEHDDVLYFEPIAWMPLPEPYKAESEDKE